MTNLFKISIVTAVYNRVSTVEQAIRSVQSQKNISYEHIIIDGASTDGTLELLQALKNDNTVLISEPDDGLYAALNSGFRRSTGEIIGLMHSDDFYADDQVLENIQEIFRDPTVDAVYGDLDYVHKDDTRVIIRRWRSGEYSKEKLLKGWMPPHPTLFLRRCVVERFGYFNTDFKISADYDAILRYFLVGKIKVFYISRVLVKMRVGGESNKSLGKIFQKSYEDYLAMKNNGIGGVFSLILKNISKINQYL